MANEQQQQSNLVRIGALWINETKHGDRCLTGVMGSARLLIFKNKFKDDPNNPDYYAYVAPRPPKDKKDAAPEPTKDAFQDELAGSPSTPYDGYHPDDIPF